VAQLLRKLLGREKLVRGWGAVSLTNGLPRACKRQNIARRIESRQLEENIASLAVIGIHDAWLIPVA